MSAPTTVLAQVLQEHGATCACEGACGVEHVTGECRERRSHKVELIAAPYPLPLTEHETASAPAASLVPWCVPCWRKAKKRNLQLAAELRRQELNEAQTALPMDLFAAGGGR